MDWIQIKWRIIYKWYENDLRRIQYFFLNVGQSLSKQIPPENFSPDTYIKTTVVYSLYLEPVTESEITKLVNSLKFAAPGYDNLMFNFETVLVIIRCVSTGFANE